VPIFRVADSRAAVYAQSRAAFRAACSRAPELPELFRVVSELPLRVVIGHMSKTTTRIEILFYFHFITLSLHHDEVVNGTDVLKRLHALIERLF